MKNIYFLIVLILGMSSCKTTQQQVLVGYQNQKTNTCYVDEPIYQNKVDGQGNLILDSKGNPIKEFTGKYRKVQSPCFILDSAFVKRDINNDGILDDIFIGMDTVWLAEEKLDNQQPNAIILPQRGSVAQITNPPLVVPAQLPYAQYQILYITKPSIGYYKYYGHWPFVYYPPLWWRYQYHCRNGWVL